MTRKQYPPRSAVFHAIQPRSEARENLLDPALAAALDACDTRSLRELAAELGEAEASDRAALKRALQRRRALHVFEALECLDGAEVKQVLARQRPSAEEPSPRTRAPSERALSPRSHQPAIARLAPPTFVALDFETANPQRDSACAVAAVRVEAGRITGSVASYLRPQGPGAWSRAYFHPRHSQIHGITPATVAQAPTLRQLWPQLSQLFAGASFLVAHNAPFDRSVLEASCASVGLRPPQLPFVCTVQLSRRCLQLPSARLPVVARHLGIPLDHHDALSDATACARVALAVWARMPEAFDVVQARSARA